MLEDLRDYGLVWQREVTSTHVFHLSLLNTLSPTGILTEVQPYTIGNNINLFVASPSFVNGNWLRSSGARLHRTRN